MERLIKKNISVLVISDAAAKLLPLLTFPYITRVMGPEMYGKYGFAMGIVGFVMLLASPGFTTYGIRAVAQASGDEKLLASKITGIRLIFCCCALLLVAVYTFALAPSDSTLRTLILIGALPLLSNALGLEWMLIGASKVLPVAVANIAGQLIYTVLVLVFLDSPESAWVVPVATFVGALGALSIGYAYVRRLFGVGWPTLSLGDFREIVPPSLLLGFASLMSLLYDKIDVVMMGYFRPMDEVGLYSATYKLMWMVMSFLPILSTVFLPLVAKSAAGDSGLGGEESALYLKYFFLAACPLVAGGMLVAQPLAEFVLGREYGGSGALFATLLLNVLCGGLAIYYAGLRLVALNKNREYLVAVSTGAVVNVGLNLVAIPLWGGIGAAVTTCLSQAAVAAAAAWYARRDEGPRLLADAGFPIAASLLMAVLLQTAMSMVPGLHVLAAVAAGAAIYGALWVLARAGKFA